MATREFALQKLGNALAEFATISEAPAGADLDHIQGSETGLPAGVGSGEESLLDEWLGRLNRIAEVMTVEAERHKGRAGPVGRAEAQDLRIQTLWRGESPRYIAFVEDVSEQYVRKLLQGREVLGS